MYRPQGGGVQLEHAVPEGRVIHALQPVRPEMTVEQGHHPVGHPGGEVDAIGDVPDRHARHFALGPERSPHLAGLLAVTAGDAVHARREPDGRDRHVEAALVECGMSSETQKLLAADPHLLPHLGGSNALLDLLGGERVVSSRHWRMGREHAGRSHAADRFGERAAARHELSHALDQHEGGVAFVGVPDGRVEPQSAQHPHTAHTENPFLSQPQLRPAGVKPIRQAAVGSVVLVEVGIQQEDRHAAHHNAPGPDAHGPPRHPHRGEARVALRSAHLL